MTNTNAPTTENYEEYAKAFIRALENTRGQPLHDYLIEVVTALSTDRAKWVLDMEGDEERFKNMSGT